MDISKLRTQFPLSPRKFWKKVIEKALVFLLIAIIGFVVVFIPQSVSDSSGTSILLWATLSAILVFILLTGVYATYVHYYIKSYYYEDDEDFLTIKKGVFAPTEIHVQYLKIQDVYVDQDILDRILGIYDVHISSATASSGMEAHIDGVEKTAANGLKDLILGKIRNSSNKFTGGAVPTTNTSANGSGVAASGRPVNFQGQVSSSTYGLNSAWWISEFSKIAVGSVVTPLVIALWVYFSLTEDQPLPLSGWKWIFWAWLAALFVYLIWSCVKLYLWKTHYKYDFGAEYIYMKIGILSISEKNMAYNTIQDVKVNQSFIDRIFGVADVVIENASPTVIATSKFSRNAAKIGANGIVIEGLLLPDAKKVADELKGVIRNTVGINKGL